MYSSSPEKPALAGRPRPAWVDHAAAALVLTIATVTRLAVDPVLGANYPSVTYFLAVAAVAWFGRTSSAVFTLVIGGLLTVYLFAPNDRSVLVGVGLYVMAASVIVSMSHSMRQARRATERLLAEAEEQREQLRITLASIGDAVITTDVAGRVTNLNAAAETLTGWTSARAVGQPLTRVFKIVNEDTRVTTENPALRALEQGVVTGLANHTLLIAKDGTERAIDDSAAPIRRKNGEVTGSVLVFRDITEKKRTQQVVLQLAAESERQRRLYETVLANTPDFVYVFSLDHKVLYANEALVRMWGRGREGAIGKTFLEIGYEPWHAEMHGREIDQVRSTRQPLRGVVPFNGTEGRRQYDYIFVPVIGADGEVEAVAGTTRDITDRLQAEEQLKANEARQSFLVTLADTIRPLHDPVAVQAEASRVLGEHLGANRVAYFEIRNDEYVIERDHAVGVSTLAGRYPVSAFGPYLLGALLAGRTVVEADATSEPMRPPDERAAFAAVEVRGHVDVPLVKGGRFVAGMTVHARDPREWTGHEIAIIEETAERTWAALERARIEASLRESEERAAFVRRASGVGFWYCDLPFDVLQWDDLVKSHFHLPPEAVVTIQTFYDRIHPDDREPTRLAIEKSISGRTHYNTDYRTVSATTGDVTWIRAIGRTFYAPDGTPTRFDGVTLDVSDEKRAETSLRESEERRRLALDAAELGAWHIDPATNTLTTDDRFRRIFSGSTEALDYEQAFAAVHPDDRERVEAAVAAATRPTDPAPYAEEYRVIHQDGSVRWVFARGRANYDRAHELVSFDGTLADVTDGKLIEDERERLVNQLREEDRRKDEFLATLAHELRNPLAPIRNGLQIIRLAGAEGIVQQVLSMMERQLTQMTRLVDDLLDVSRVNTGKFQLRRERLDLRLVITAALETSQPLIDQEGHGLAVVMPARPIFVDGDAVRLAQVVSNLLNNAAKYTPRGGHIRVSVAPDDSGGVVVAVTDDGIGIPTEMLDAVFGMFSQVDRSLEKSTGGLGIELSLVKGLVEMHGGSIEAQSEGQGKGSEFRVRLPVTAPAVSGAVPNDSAELQVHRGGPCRVLVVEDNVDSADSLGQLLEMMGHEVQIAYDGAAGVEAARSFGPCIVLCDIGMPKLNGYETARHIRAETWGKDTILVALTGWSQEENLQKSANAGFDHHLVKPVQADALMSLLASLRPVKE